jgi:hypothetical protein
MHKTRRFTKPRRIFDENFLAENEGRTRPRIVSDEHGRILQRGASLGHAITTL